MIPSDMPDPSGPTTRSTWLIRPHGPAEAAWKLPYTGSFHQGAAVVLGALMAGSGQIEDGTGLLVWLALAVWLVVHMLWPSWLTRPVARVVWTDDELRVWTGDPERSDPEPDQVLAWSAGSDPVYVEGTDLVFTSASGTVRVPAPRKATPREAVVEALRHPPRAPPPVPWEGGLSEGRMVVRAQRPGRLFPRWHRAPPHPGLLAGALIAANLGFVTLLGLLGYGVGTSLLSGLGLLTGLGLALGWAARMATEAGALMTVTVRRQGLTLTHRRTTWTWDWEELRSVHAEGRWLVIDDGYEVVRLDLRQAPDDIAAGLARDLSSRVATYGAGGAEREQARQAAAALAELSRRSQASASTRE